MRENIFLTFLFLIFFFTSCEKDRIFQDFKSIHQSKTLPNCSHPPTKWNNVNDEIISKCPEKNFEFHFDIVDKNNSLIFSIGNPDKIGNLIFDNNIVYFKPKLNNKRYILFDFDKKVGSKYNVKNCGLLSNDILQITEIENRDDEIIQRISVSKNKSNVKLNIPNQIKLNTKSTKIKELKVSSKRGILEIKMFVDWANKIVEIKNTP
ncbi:hypothetical protein [Psychroflexus halocasei]|uniref:Lipoprotein n=1 Tax=Psychroflexus halocasei TaxID=908615 RepID=A0A1H4E5M0_9FLAO|nr:hypothetical protein [Psychroflexus halocasei]SEA80058.1 hypothetical protein SAMN05421540_1281 [Psychroflexus halocasei]